ncbi:predicted protein [Nematostella vectensis]|uniref:Uncharacterized protein n=1 Tax=Nematostella vectensis TaxID=45351 RepID=A7SW07_NEMVE|nr:predicted protein [Nematostella vectensis]|eukprot:XP_001624215.1 predicted protein [Nematostella vectensis]
MLGQDIVYAVTGSQVKTPKHIGLAVTLHHLTGSKEVVMGCASNDDVMIVNTAWAKGMTAGAEDTGIIVPSNKSPGLLVQFAANNNDLYEQTLGGYQRTTHETTVAVYQRQLFGPPPPPPPKAHADHSAKRRPLEQPVKGQVIEECSIGGKRPAVTTFVGKARESCLIPQEESSQSMVKKDLAWFLLGRILNSAQLASCNRKEVSGKRTVFIESGIYGSSSTAALLQGKSYNRGVKKHNLSMEALLRLQWLAFLVWIKKEEETSAEENGLCNFQLINATIQRYMQATLQKRKDAYLVLCNTTQDVDTLLRRFKESKSSKLFRFWDDNIKMVLLLLKFISAKRKGNWQLHLAATV